MGSGWNWCIYPSSKVSGQASFISRVQIIASHFPNCKVNSSYWNCSFKSGKQCGGVFSLRKFNLSTLSISTFYPHFTAYYYQKETLFSPINTLINAKNISQFLKKTIDCGRLKLFLCLPYLLWKEFQTIIWMLISMVFNCLCADIVQLPYLHMLIKQESITSQKLGSWDFWQMNNEQNIFFYKIYIFQFTNFKGIQYKLQ